MEKRCKSNQIKVLVTGANGQLGSEIQSLSDLYGDISFVFTDLDTLDITNNEFVESFFRNFNPDFVVNCAAYTAVDKAEDEEDKAEALNVKAPSNLARGASEHGYKLIHISTDYVFNGRTWEPYSEDHPVSPNSVYGMTKQKGEEAVLKSAEAMVIRTSWLYSAFGNNFVKTIINKGKNSDELRVVFDQIGTPTWANDLARAILEIIVKGKENFVPEVFHFSNEGVCSWYDFAKEISDYCKFKCSIMPVLSSEYPSKANRPPYSVLSKAKIKNVYSIIIPYWKDSLHSCLSIINKNS